MQGIETIVRQNRQAKEQGWNVGAAVGAARVPFKLYNVVEAFAGGTGAIVEERITLAQASKYHDKLNAGTYELVAI